ncbi:extensin family protein [Qipengyuania sp. XHP0207]|nr:extensin family protein [Qipengyuania sp. XHP0207]MDG5748484.1 extensin family protein [Qipengyuania sp. XHP0207]
MTTLFSRRIGKFRADRRVVGALLLLGLLLAGRVWLAGHPQHNPWAPLNLRDPAGWATQSKLLKLRDDPVQCRAVLERSDVAFSTLDPAGEGACRREDRTRLSAFPLSPDTPAITCPAAVALHIWERDVLTPLAQETLDSGIAQIRHLGAYSCRRLYGRDEGPWSEHATANAIDIAGFELEDGRYISVLRDWQGNTPEAEFLRKAHQGACDGFSTVLGPDYNAAHADHLHLDMSPRWRGVCR